MSKISVIVPVYNVEPYLARCVDSILRQTFSDFELILVDDGSPDNCPALCDAYAAQDRRIHVIHQQNGGLSAARNVGIDWAFSNSDSEWLTFIDSDDWIHPSMLSCLYNAVKKNNSFIGVCNLIETDGIEPEVFPTHTVTLWKPEDFFVEHPLNATVAWGKLYYKNCFTNIRYPVGKLHEDEFTTYKLLFPQKNIAVLSDSLYYYFQNPTGITGSAWSPKRLDAAVARREQIEYFNNAGFISARNHSGMALLWSHCTYIDQLEKIGDGKNISLIRNHLRHDLHRYRHMLSVSLKQNYGIYEAAYPCCMKLYWYCMALWRKLGLSEQR